MTELTKAEIDDLDPYRFLAVLGKNVVRPGGHVSTEQLFDLAQIKPDDHVLEVGCGTCATAIELVQRFGCRVTAMDRSALMLEKAAELVEEAGVADRITLDQADMLKMQYEDDTFDVVVIEAVTMFTPRLLAVRECVRVLKPGGQLLDQEFVWRTTPDARALEILRQPKMCPRIDFDDVADWKRLFEQAGLGDVEAVTGPFALMHPRVFVKDEGWRNTFHILGRAFSRPAYLSKLVWLLGNIVRIMPKLGYIVVSARKPAPATG
jgi:SAM-dependent methyltransferase